MWVDWMPNLWLAVMVLLPSRFLFVLRCQFSITLSLSLSLSPPLCFSSSHPLFPFLLMSSHSMIQESSHECKELLHPPHRAILRGQLKNSLCLLALKKALCGVSLSTRLTLHAGRVEITQPSQGTERLCNPFLALWKKKKFLKYLKVQSLIIFHSNFSLNSSSCPSSVQAQSWHCK